MSEVNDDDEPPAYYIDVFERAPPDIGDLIEASGVDLGSVARLAVRILVADDHPVHRQHANALFSALGASVVTVEDGMSVLQACASQRFDLVLLDRHMPGLDGDETARRLRFGWGARQGPYIACCSSDPPTDLSAGYDAVVPKPLTVVAAVSLLNVIFARSV